MSSIDYESIMICPIDINLLLGNDVIDEVE